jgi:hypothetical protein
MRFIVKSPLLQAASLLFVSVALFAVPANAQQEVAPEHFDVQPAPQAKRQALQPKQTAHTSHGALGRTLPDQLGSAPRQHRHSEKADREAGRCEADGNGTSKNREIKEEETVLPGVDANPHFCDG